MKLVSLDSLASELAKPGFERQLIPLLMYKGRADLGRYHRLWNLVVAMMMHEAESISEGITHLQLNPEWSQLCFPEKRVQHCGMRGFLNRLRDNRAVTDLVPGLTEYVEWLMPRYFPYERVPLEASRSRCAWWRVFERKGPLAPPDGFAEVADDKANGDLADLFGVSIYHVAKWKRALEIAAFRGRHREALSPPDDFYEVANGRSRAWVQRHYGRSQLVVSRWFEETNAESAAALAAQLLAYPYLVHEGKGPEHELLRLINAAIPQHLPPDLRADMCQDLAIGCLIGDFNKDDLHLPAKEVAKRVYRMFPTKYGPISLDAPMFADSNVRLLDTLVDEGRDWA